MSFGLGPGSGLVSGWPDQLPEEEQDSKAMKGDIALSSLPVLEGHVTSQKAINLIVRVAKKSCGLKARARISQLLVRFVVDILET